MKRTWWLLATVLVALMVALPAQASVNGLVDQNDDLKIADLPPGWAGGPFQIEIFDDGRPIADALHQGPSIRGPRTTFCVETQDSISFSPGWYNVYSVTMTNSQNRNLKGYAAWVYDVWRAKEGSIASAADKMAFQKAIWAGISSGAVNTSGSEYYAEYGSNITVWTPYQGLGTSNNIDIDYATFVAANGLGGNGLNYTADYYFVDLGSSGGAQAQFLNGPEFPGIPEPASLIIWSVAGGLGAAGLGLRKRPRGRWSDENRQAIMDVVKGRARQQ